MASHSTFPRPTRTRTSLPGHSRAAKLKKDVDGDDEMMMEDAGPSDAPQADEEPVEEPSGQQSGFVPPPFKAKKADKAYAKREALLAKITAMQNPYSKSHERRLKRAAKPENNLITSLSAVEDTLPTVAAVEEELRGMREGEKEAAKAKAEGGKGQEKLTAKKRQRVLSQETARLPAVMSNPAFATNPFETIRLHTLNTMKTVTHSKKAGSGKK